MSPDKPRQLQQTNGCWYAIRVRSRFERVAAAALAGKGYEEFLPLRRSSRHWSDRSKELDLPLFPGYVFCRFDATGRLLPILTTPGVISIVGAGKTPAPIDDAEIAAIRTILGSGLAPEPWPFLDVGSRVSIVGGPLAGVEGIIVNTEKVYRLIVSVSLLQRAVAVEIDRNWAHPVNDDKYSHAAAPSGSTRLLARSSHQEP